MEIRILKLLSEIKSLIIGKVDERWQLDFNIVGN